MADRKITVEVSDNKTLDGLLKKVDQLNTALAKTQALGKDVRVGGSVAAARALGSTGVPTQKDEFGQYRNARAAVGTGAAGRDFARQAQGLGGLVHVYATFAANIFAVGAAFNALKKAMDFTVLERSMDKLGASIGRNLTNMSKDMVKATDGAIALADSMRYVALASTGGFNTKQINELTKAARGASAALGRDLADAMDRLFRGTVKMEPELLDELGIMTKANDAYREYARVVNKSVDSLTSFERRQAYVNAVIAEAQQKYGALAGEVDVNVYSQALAQLQNVLLGIGEVVNKVLGPIVGWLASSKAVMTGFITVIIGLLLKQAIPALSSWRDSVGRAAVESDEAFRRMAKGVQDSSARQAQAVISNLNIVSRGISERLLPNIQQLVGDAFKSGALKKNIAEVTSAQEALNVLKSKQNVINNAIAKTENLINNSSGQMRVNAEARLAKLREIQALTARTTDLNTAAVKQAQALLAVETEIAVVKKTQTEQSTPSRTAQRRLDAASNRRVVSEASAAVADAASFGGITAGVRSLVEEFKKMKTAAFASSQAIAGLGAAEVGANLLRGSKAAKIFSLGLFGLRGAASVAVTGLLALGATVGVVFSAVMGLMLLFEAFAWATDGNSKHIEALSSANSGLSDTLKTMEVALAKSHEELRRGIATGEEYIKNQERIANSTADLSDKLNEALITGRLFANESGAWATQLKEGFFSIFGKSELDKFNENLQKTAVMLYRSTDGKAFEGSKDYFETLNKIANAKSWSEVLAIQEQLVQKSKDLGIQNRANAEAVRNAKEFWKDVGDELRKNETSIQKQERLTREISAKLERMSVELADSMDPLRQFSLIESIQKGVDLDQLRKVGGDIGKALADAIEQAMLTSGVDILNAGTGSQGFQNLTRLAKSGQPITGETREYAIQQANAAVKAATDEYIKSFSKAGPEAQAGMKKILDSFATGLSGVIDSGSFNTLALDALRKQLLTVGQNNAVKGAGVIAGLLPGAAPAIAKIQSGNTTEKFRREQAEIKLLQEKLRLYAIEEKSLSRQIELDIERNAIITDDRFTELLNKKLQAAETEYNLSVKQIELDEKRARNEGQNISEELSLRRKIASESKTARIEEITRDVERQKLQTRLQELEKDFKPLEKRLDFLNKINETLVASGQLSEIEASKLRAQEKLLKDSLDIEKQISQEKLRSPNRAAELEAEKSIRQSILALEAGIAIELAKQKTQEDNINASITARETLLQNITSNTNSILTSEQALVELEVQKSSLAAQSAANYTKQIIALGEAATAQDRQRLALAAIADLQQKYLSLLETQVTLFDRSGDSMKAFETALSAMISKAKAEVKGAGQIMAESLMAAIDTGVDTIFDAIKDKGKLTFKELFSSVGKAFKDTILDGIKGAVKADIKSLVGDFLGIKDADQIAREEAAKQFEAQVRLYKEQSAVIINNTQAITTLSQVLIEQIKLAGPIPENIKALDDSIKQQTQSTQNLINSNQTLYSGMLQAASAMMQSGNRTVSTIGRIFNIATRAFAGYQQGGVSGAVEGAAGAMGGPFGSLLSSGTSLLGNGGMLAAGGGMVASGLNAVGLTGTSQFVGGLTGAIAGPALPGSALAMGQSALSMISAALPYIAIATALYSIFSKPGGGPKEGGSFMGQFTSGGRFNQDVNVPGSDNNRFYTPNSADANARAIGESIATSYVDTATRLGGRALGLDVGVGYDTDPQGTAQSRVSTLVRNTQTGQVLYDASNVEYGRDQSELQAGLQLESQRALLAALQASEFPDAVAEILNSVGVMEATKEQIDAVIARAIDMADALKILDGLDIEGLDSTVLQSMVRGTETLTAAAQRIGAVFSATARISSQAFGGVSIATYEAREELVNFAGGIDRFTEAMNGYYSAFFTEGENFQHAVQSLSTDLNSLGLDSIPRSNAEFRSLLESLDLTTESGRRTYASLINMSGAFDAVIGAIERTSAALGQMNLNAQDQILLDTLNEQQRYEFWRTRAEELASDDSFRDLKSPAEVQAQYEAAQNAAMNAWNQLDESGRQRYLGDFQTFLDDLLDNANSRLTELGDAATNGALSTPDVTDNPADKLIAASETAAVKLVDAFTVGADKISKAILQTTTAGSIDPDLLVEILERRITEERDRQAEDITRAAASRDEYITQMREIAETMRQAAEGVRQGGASIKEAADSPLRIELEDRTNHINK